MSYTNPIVIGGGPSNQSIFETASEARHTPGTRAQLPDGRTFEYVRSNDGTAIGHGKLVTYDPVVAAVDKIAVQAAAAIGATEVNVTVTATLAANEAVGGFLSIDDDAGEGELYPIIGHDSHTSGTLTLKIGRPVVTALTTSSTATIVLGSSSVKISAAVVAQAEPVEVAAGVTLVDVAAASAAAPVYFWVQKTGWASVLFGTAVGSIGEVVYHGEDAGSFQVANLDSDSADAEQLPALGTIAALLPVDTEYHVVNLSIA